MKIISKKITEIKVNPKNPRLIKDNKFIELVESIKQFPEMLHIRPIVVNKDMIILGGNMRYKACKEAGLKEIPVIVADKLSEEQEKEFLIKDNVSGGEWNYEMLDIDWDAKILNDWGVQINSFNDELMQLDKDINETKSSEKKSMKTDNDYSAFELVMLHENKILLIEVLNKIKKEYLFEKLEDCLMELVRVYDKSK